MPEYRLQRTHWLCNTYGKIMRTVKKHTKSGFIAIEVIVAVVTATIWTALLFAPGQTQGQKTLSTVSANILAISSAEEAYISKHHHPTDGGIVTVKILHQLQSVSKNLHISPNVHYVLKFLPGKFSRIFIIGKPNIAPTNADYLDLHVLALDPKRQNMTCVEWVKSDPKGNFSCRELGYSRDIGFVALLQKTNISPTSHKKP